MSEPAHADLREVRRVAVTAGLKPPPRLSLSQWADENFRLSAESAAQTGRWTTLPYQVGIMNAITDPTVTHITLMKSARVGYTLMVTAAIGYYMHQAPCGILLIEPTVDDAKGMSKETIAPMLRDVPVLSQIVFDDAAEKGPKDSNNTILSKHYPGGVLSLVGANSGAGLRRISRKVIIFDEVDGYPPSAGNDGDPVKLGTMRSQTFWDRKIIAGSTPLVAGASRIERMFEEGDQRKYYVPCPQCGHMAPLVFRGEAGHAMKWPEGKPEEAFFACQLNGCVIEHSQKRTMVERGEWRALKPFDGHASFHVWAAYSYSLNASWGQLAKEFVEAKRTGSEALRVFVNTVLGETWKVEGESPAWEQLYSRREIGTQNKIPEGVVFLTAGVDVQKDRWVYEVVGWGAGKESWSIDAGVIPGDTSNGADWSALDDLLDRTWTNAAGSQQALLMLAVDSGFQTNVVYNWARRHPMNRVMAVKGVSTARVLLGSPSPVDVLINGKRHSRGYKVWPLGVDVAKAELYGWLKLPTPVEGEPYPGGYCHFPEYGPDYFKQLTAEHLVSVQTRQGFIKYEWQLQPGRENHWLDARVYARAAASLAGLDRLAPRRVAPPVTAPMVLPVPAATPSVPRASSGFLNKGGSYSDSRFHGNGWLSKKR